MSEIEVHPGICMKIKESEKEHVQATCSKVRGGLEREGVYENIGNRGSSGYVYENKRERERTRASNVLQGPGRAGAERG
jgi:hypothetical protein